MFPSPCGEKVMKNIDQTINKDVQKFYGLAFPSPCGEKVMKNRHTFVIVAWFDKEFPSPCGEKVMKNIKFQKSSSNRLKRFHPLAGKRL
jgi:hypothetical protein